MEDDGKMMELDAFWWTIEMAREQSQSQVEMAHALEILLESLLEREVAAFAWRFDERIDFANDYDLWGTAYVLRGGCSDDSFLDFRYWLVSRGRIIYETVTQTPHRLVEVPNCRECLFEQFGYVATKVYSMRTGDQLPQQPLPPNRVPGPRGTPFDDSEDSLKSRFSVAWKAVKDASVD